jgi:hypothetical protein
MSYTVFGDNCFTRDAIDLYNHVVAQDKVKQHLAIIDSYNSPTAAHNRGVGQLVAEYAVSGIVDYNSDQKEQIVRVAMLHDLGKLSVSNLILDKAGRLDHEEWQEIQKHPVDGYHRYALAFDATEALPILMHHSLQLRDYPTPEEQRQEVSIHNLASNELKDEQALTNMVMVAVADHFEARYPITDLAHPLAGIRSYAHREYGVDDLPMLVKASFVEAGRVHKIKLNGLLNKLVECSQEVILKTKR